MGLVNIQKIDPSILVELRYATKNNFTGRVVYDFTECFLVEKAAFALAEVQEDLQKKGLGLKVWDGYRPFKAQELFWELVPDERYVANPKKGGSHTKGIAVDVTLVDSSGKELPMPSHFDDFSQKAHGDYEEASPEEIRNREILRKAMEKRGFLALPTEWWHFSFEP